LLNKPSSDHKICIMARQTQKQPAKVAEDGHGPGRSGATPTPSPTPSTRCPRAPKPWVPLIIKGTNKLLQRKYNNYTSTLQIFHYASSHLPLESFTRLLTRKAHGYIATLYSSDPLRNKPAPEGDETPIGCTEVIYLPSVFHVHGPTDGSALGFRTGAAEEGALANTVQWLCFSRPVDTRILFKIKIPRRTVNGRKKRRVNGGKLFHHVGDLEKEVVKMKRVRNGESGDRGEYWGWWAALKQAGHPRRRVGISWRGFGRDLKAYWEEKRRQEGVEAGVEECWHQYGEGELERAIDDEEDEWEDLGIECDSEALDMGVDIEQGIEHGIQIFAFTAPDQSHDGEDGATTLLIPGRDDV
ncbi:hypothetical protein T440DRAFT_401560, partial [Plenodomus tracheiphilus IPT5]